MEAKERFFAEVDAFLYAVPGMSASETAPYIVTFSKDVRNPDKLTTELARQFHFEPTHRFSQLIVGFAARLTPEVVAALRKEPRVASIELDRGLTP